MEKLAISDKDYAIGEPVVLGGIAPSEWRAKGRLQHVEDGQSIRHCGNVACYQSGGLYPRVAYQKIFVEHIELILSSGVFCHKGSLPSMVRFKGCCSWGTNCLAVQLWRRCEQWHHEATSRVCMSMCKTLHLGAARRWRRFDCLGLCREANIAVLPKTTNKARMKESANLSTLDEET